MHLSNSAAKINFKKAIISNLASPSFNRRVTYFSSGFQESGSGASFGSGEKYRSMLILPDSVLGTLLKLAL